MNHYFTDNRHLAQNRKEIAFRFSCFTYRFITDNGVFCKDYVDMGSQVLIETINRKQILGKRILDLGCGYGVIAIVLAKLFPQRDWTLAEINPRSLALADENAKLNDVKARCVHSDVYSEVEGNTFTDIITNPPIRAGKEVVYRMLDGAYEHLEDGGRLWVVIRKQQGAPSAKKRIEERFGNCEILERSKGYYILFAQKLDNLTVD